MLEVDNMVIDLNVFYLRGISFRLEKGERCAFIGPTGAGKSVLLETIAGFHSLLKGNVYMEGKKINRLPTEYRNMTVVYQDNMLFPHFSVYGNIAFGLKKKSKSKIEKRVKNISRELGIEHLLSRRPGTLSCGEQQRAALARALIVRPKLLIMDEPFSSLDPQTCDEIREIVDKLLQRDNTTLLYSTHNRDDVRYLANKAGLVQNGMLLRFGKVGEIFTNPGHEYLAKFAPFLETG